MLRWLAAAVGVLVLVRIGWEPRIVGSDIGTTPIFNWILYGYGVPAAGVLGRRISPAPARRRCAGPHGRVAAHPVHRAARHAAKSATTSTAATSTPGQRPDRDRAAGLRSGSPWRSGSSTCACARRAWCTTSARIIVAALTLARHRVRPGLFAQSAVHRRAGRRPVHQPDPARLRPARRAGDRARAGRRAHPADALSRSVAAVTAVVALDPLSHARSAPALPRRRCSTVDRPAMPSSTPTRRCGSPTAWCCCSPESCCARSRRGSPPPR